MNMKAIPGSLLGWTRIAGTHWPYSITSFEIMHIIWFLLLVSSHGFKQCPCKIAEHNHHFYKHDIYLKKTFTIMKRKFKQWWSSISPISTKRRITSHLNSLNIKRPPHMTLEIQVWDKHNNVAGLNLLMGSQPSPLDNWISTLSPW